MGNWTLNDEQAQKIIETEPTKVKKPNYFNGFHLSKEDRIKYAKKALEKWKK